MNPTTATTTANEQLGKNGTTTEGNVAENETVEYQKMTLFNNPDALVIFRAFIRYDWQSQIGHTDGSAMPLARLDVWLCAGFFCLAGSEKRSGQRQEIYADTYETFLSNEIIGRVHIVVLMCELHELVVQEVEGDLQVRKEAVANVTRVEIAFVGTCSKQYLALEQG